MNQALQLACAPCFGRLATQTQPYDHSIVCICQANTSCSTCMHIQRTEYVSLAVQAPCTVDSTDASTCMNGFSIQGNFEAARRNYTRLWLQVEHAMAAGAVPTQPPARPFNLHLVGRGNVSTLNMPAAVEKYTTVHFNLKFSDYYDQVNWGGMVQKAHGRCAKSPVMGCWM